MVAATADSISDFSSGFFHSGSLTAENRHLRTMAEAEKLYNVRLGELQSKIDGLQKLLNLDVPGHKRLPARIIGVFPDENRATISAGSAEGVVAGVPIVAPGGLLGLVQTVDTHTSQATLIWSPLPFKIGAMVAGKPDSAGLMHGDAPDRLILDLNLNAPVQVGDLVVTSGFSAKIPRGLPIGRVVQVQQDQDFGTERAQIVPNVEIGDVQEVVVLR
jgi:rod shape-determining protein MreC